MWGSSVDFQNGANSAFELDLQAGYTWQLSPDWSSQLSYVHYAYLNDNDSGYDYDEVSASVSYQQRATASVSWSPNTSKHTYWGLVADKQALAYEFSLLQPLHPNWSVYAGAGYYDLRDLVDTGYWYWSAGVAFTYQSMGGARLSRLPEIVDWDVDKKIDLDSLVTHRLKLEQIGEGFEMMKRGESIRSVVVL